MTSASSAEPTWAAQKLQGRNTTTNLEKNELRAKNSFLSQFDVVLFGGHICNQAALVGI